MLFFSLLPLLMLYILNMKGHRITALMFYAPWCSHSKAMLPEWDRISARPPVPTDIEPVYFAKVDCVANSEIYYSENIEVFPTLKFYYYGIPIDYEGDNDFHSLNEFVNFLDYDNIDFDIQSQEQVRLFSLLFVRSPLKENGGEKREWREDEEE